jgi:hypothetical protein
MKIIFSRKGFDSQYGGIPSPIFPDGSLLSLPIPTSFGQEASTIDTKFGSLYDLISQLQSPKNIDPAYSVHLDPDLTYNRTKRKENWRPTIGQTGSAQGHLSNQNISVGDIFLFFGWFRRTELKNGKLKYQPKTPGIHSLFGWLQVDQILKVGEVFSAPPWLDDHPHVIHKEKMGKNNCIYVGREFLTDGDSIIDLPGAGAFSKWSADLQLSAQGESKKSIWKMPDWMAEASTPPELSYHPKERWSKKDGGLFLASAGKGQEFVTSIDNTNGLDWIVKLIERHTQQ